MKYQYIYFFSRQHSIYRQLPKNNLSTLDFGRKVVIKNMLDILISET